MRFVPALWLSLLLAAPVAAADDYVWWEGESHFNTNFLSECDFAARNYPQNRQVLSGNDWLCYSGPPLIVLDPIAARSCAGKLARMLARSRKRVVRRLKSC